MQFLVAALAAAGGLRTGAAVDAAMREAAAAPEWEFRQLIDVVSAAISEQINAGRLPEQRRYASLSPVYSDRAVVELDGKHYQYAYAIKHVAGSDQVAPWHPQTVRACRIAPSPAWDCVLHGGPGAVGRIAPVDTASTPTPPLLNSKFTARPPRAVFLGHLVGSASLSRTPAHGPSATAQPLMPGIKSV